MELGNSDGHQYQALQHDTLGPQCVLKTQQGAL
jgi:hypothetical protein